MGLTLDGHHRRVVDLRLGDLKNGNIRLQLLIVVCVKLQVLLGVALLLALPLLPITPLAGQLPPLHL